MASPGVQEWADNGTMPPKAQPTPLDPDVKRVLEALRWIVRELRLAQAPGLPGLSAAQIFVLHVLKENGPLSVNELASWTATDPSSVSVVVRKLQERAYVRKQASPEDGRRMMVSLTATGSRVAGQTATPIQQVLIRRMVGLEPRNLKRLADLLEQVAPPSEGEPAPMFFQEDGRA